MKRHSNKDKELTPLEFYGKVSGNKKADLCLPILEQKKKIQLIAKMYQNNENRKFYFLTFASTAKHQ